MHSLLAATGGHHRGPGYYLAIGPTFMVLGLLTMARPTWVRSANQFLIKRYRWAQRARADAEARGTVPDLTERQMVRRARIVGAVIVGLGAAALVWGIHLVRR